jgi:hypothetical protein
MFEWLNKQGVRSSDGFEFLFTGRFTAEYREGEHVIDLEVDGAPIVDLNNGGPLVWRRGSKLSPEATDRVLKNIKAALEFMDLRFWEYKPPFK